MVVSGQVWLLRTVGIGERQGGLAPEDGRRHKRMTTDVGRSDSQARDSKYPLGVYGLHTLVACANILVVVFGWGGTQHLSSKRAEPGCHFGGSRCQASGLVPNQALCQAELHPGRRYALVYP